MRFYITTVVLLLLCATSTASAQTGTQKKAPFVVVPDEAVLISVAFQPGCPLRFEDVKLMERVDSGQGGADFQLRNVGAKPVKSVTWATWTYSEKASGSAISMDSWPRRSTASAVMPGQLIPLSEGEEVEEIVPWTKELSNKLGLDKPLGVVTILMVLRVDYADGTAYIDRPRIQSLEGDLGHDLVKELLGK